MIKTLVVGMERHLSASLHRFNSWDLACRPDDVQRYEPASPLVAATTAWIWSAGSSLRPPVS